MAYRIFYRFCLLFTYFFVCGCQNIQLRDTHVCSVYLESEKENSEYSVIKILPVSMTAISVIPIPVLNDKEIKDVSIIHGQYGTMLSVHFTDRGAYELYQLSFEATNRRLILEYDNTVIGFSILSSNNSRDFIFIPEVSDSACQTLCNFIKSQKRW